MATGIFGRRSLHRAVQASSWQLLLRSMGTETAAAASSEQIAGRKSKKEGKRFYEKAHARPSEKDGYEVLLDHRVLRTPAKKPLKLPNPALALAVAAEWEWQDSSGIRAFTMPLVRLTSITLDQVPTDREKIIATLLKYCHTDTLCCRADEGSKLADKQVKLWDPLLDWAEKEVGARPVVSSSIFGTIQPYPVIFALDKTLRSMSDWELAAVDSLAGAAKSLVVALAIARNELSIERAIDIIRVEEEHQIEDWGHVEGGHDIDIADLRVQITAASVFLRLLNH
ncbi:hypothetical protein AXG93_4101s1050 [Marchantia polymorpha subsp. ruderalis]|nr:hypothetical protein AXG93_4101s1050 [Marchantia polymorpha subsp. ruderalis]